MTPENFVVVSNISDNPFAIELARHLGQTLDVSDAIHLKDYANTEFCPRFISSETEMDRIGRSLEGKTVVIASSTNARYTRNALAMRTMIVARAAKDNGAARVILVEPDLFYSAQDRGPTRNGELEKDRSEKDLKKFDGQPFTARLYADLLKLAGVDAVVTVHNHSAKVQALFKETFGGQFYNLIPVDVYADYIKRSDIVQVGKDGANLVLCAPDAGATPFVELVQKTLDLPGVKRIVMRKERTGERSVTMSLAESSEIGVDEIAGRDVIVLDDMVRTGTTIIQCSEALKAGHTGKVCFGVTHFHTSIEARENLNSPFLDEIMTTNTISTILNRDEQGRLRKKLTVLKLSKWIARHVMELLGTYDGRYDRAFYSIDMSSQNKRWPPMQPSGL
ncbi:MAG: ribose-phosphate pyrophosphokinase [Fibrobacterales bacterium]|nr:ribose-phosphate pyrophosphokinase [Fibrobacterales bacterium]